MGIKVLLCVCVSALALAEYDFELILALSGAFKLLATYVGPCILEWKSTQYMNHICSDNGQEDAAVTPVTKAWISHKAWLYVIVVVSVVAFFAVFVTTIIQYA